MNLSIKQRITILYTLFFLVLIGLNILLLFNLSGSRIDFVASEEIRDVTEEVLEELTITSNGVFLRDEDDIEPFYFFREGITFVVFENSRILGGTYPAAVDPAIPIQNLNVQQYQDDVGRWVIYDVALAAPYTLRAFYNYSNIAGVYDQVFYVLLLLAPLLLVLTAVGGWMILRYAFKPLKLVTTTAQSIVTQENYGLRIPESNQTNEVSTLVTTVNTMLQSMEQSLTKEKQFSSNISHELRTPLSTIKAQLELLTQQTKKTITREQIQPLLEQVNVMSEIIQQILDWSRSQHQILPLESIDLFPVIETVVDQLEPTANKKGLQLTFELPKEAVFVKATVASLHRIVTNVVHNAIKFTQQGQVTISAINQSSSVMIRVRDTGIGMTPEQQKYIFDSFYQVDESRSHETVSLGIGLTMTKELIHTLNGTIDVESTLSQGTIVTITLPTTK